MSWIQKLYETYERCAGNEPPGSVPLMPIAHTTQQAHIEIVINNQGGFRRASLIQKEEIALPATEGSAGRTSGEAAHPLCDKIQYCAGDYQAFDGQKDAYFDGYLMQLQAWCASEFCHPKAKAVLKYVEGRSMVRDLAESGILSVQDGRLLVRIKIKGGKNASEETIPEVFRLLPQKDEKSRKVQDQGDAFVRWRIDSPGDVCTGVWEDKSLQLAWQNYEASRRTSSGFCMITGLERPLADQHPSKLRHGGDKAKLISSNDTSGYTFRGRFIDADQAVGVGFEVTQKAHNALRWLIHRQGIRNGDQVFVAWAVGGQAIPDPWCDSMNLFDFDNGPNQVGNNTENSNPGDVGQAFAKRLNRAIAGYRSTLHDDEDIVVMGLESATPGRLGITYYRELKGSEFLERVLSWHGKTAWPQDFAKDSKFVGAPSPRDIAEAAYGRRIDDKLRKATIERLTPCIIDGMHLPRDLVDACVRRAFNRVGLEIWEWEKCLGVACALYKGFHDERGYKMSLDEDRKTRDYLYGRLLAVAEHIEGRALYAAGEKRDTTAARLMQRFADRPYSTWRTIELGLTPYKSRLRSSRGAFLWEMEELLDGLIHSFSDDEKEAFANDRPLSGEFLLSYHCQRQKLRPQFKNPEDVTINND